MNQARKKRAWKIFEAMQKKREEVGNTILNLAWNGVPEDLRCRWNDVTRLSNEHTPWLEWYRADPDFMTLYAPALSEPDPALRTQAVKAFLDRYEVEIRSKAVDA